MTKRAIAGYCLIASTAIASAQGPVGRYYLAAGDQGMDWCVQGAGVVNSWTQAVAGEYPLAINNNLVKATGVGVGGQGAGYTLAGVDTGVRYVNSMPSGAIYDGASDGAHNFAVDYSGGNVYQFNANWGAATLLFGGLGGGAYLGITYDGTNNSLWISRWSGSVVENRTMAGGLISSFTVPFSSISCLAMDTDNTLWMGSQLTYGTYYHYSRAGASLGQVSYGTMTSQNTLGGEIAPVPEPTTLLAVGLGVLALRRRRRA